MKPSRAGSGRRAARQPRSPATWRRRTAGEASARGWDTSAPCSRGSTRPADGQNSGLILSTRRGALQMGGQLWTRFDIDEDAGVIHLATPRQNSIGLYLHGSRRQQRLLRRASWAIPSPRLSSARAASSGAGRPAITARSPTSSATAAPPPRRQGGRCQPGYNGSRSSMARNGEGVLIAGVAIETYVDGDGPALALLPS